MTVFQNVAYGIGDGKAKTQEEKDRVRKYLDLTGILDLEKRYPHELSGGQQQRVALARSLAPMPELLLLDEPFSALDEHLRFQIRDEVMNIVRKSNTTAIMVTHDREEAISLSDKIVVLFAGKVAQYDTPQNVYYDSSNLVVAEFVGDLVKLDAIVNNGKAHCALGALDMVNGEIQDGAKGTVMVRPEQIILRKNNVTGALAKVRLHDLQFKGPYSKAVLQVTDQERKEVLKRHGIIEDADADMFIELRLDNSIHPKKNEDYYVEVVSEVKFFGDEVEQQNLVQQD